MILNVAGEGESLGSAFPGYIFRKLMGLGQRPSVPGSFPQFLFQEILLLPQSPLFGALVNRQPQG